MATVAIQYFNRLREAAKAYRCTSALMVALVIMTFASFGLAYLPVQPPSSDELVAYLLDPSGTGPVPYPLDKYTIKARRTRFNDHLRARIERMIDDASQAPSGSSKCFSPHLAFTQGTGPHRIEIIICTSCHWVAFFQDGERQRGTRLSKDEAAAFDELQFELFHR